MFMLPCFRPHGRYVDRSESLAHLRFVEQAVFRWGQRLKICDLVVFGVAINVMDNISIGYRAMRRLVNRPMEKCIVITVIPNARIPGPPAPFNRAIFLFHTILYSLYKYK